MTNEHNDTPAYRIELTNVASTEARDYIRQQLQAFNDAMSQHHRDIRRQGTVSLDLYVRNVDGQIVGGLTAETYWDWLLVDKLWLSEQVRKHGYGRQLMLAAEAEACKRGCARAYLTTFSFQARGFYEKLGYRVVGQLDDYPPGHTYFWLRKDGLSGNGQ